MMERDRREQSGVERGWGRPAGFTRS